jgi:hypothetical protein
LIDGRDGTDDVLTLGDERLLDKGYRILDLLDLVE